MKVSNLKSLLDKFIKTLQRTNEKHPLPAVVQVNEVNKLTVVIIKQFCLCGTDLTLFYRVHSLFILWEQNKYHSCNDCNGLVKT